MGDNPLPAAPGRVTTHVSKILEKILRIIMYYNLHKGRNMTLIMRSMKWPPRDRQMIKALAQLYEYYK